MSVLSKFLRKRHAVKVARRKSELEDLAPRDYLEPLEPVVVAKENDPQISAAKAAKETVDLIPAYMISAACLAAGHYTGFDIDPVDVMATLTAVVTIYKFCSKYYRDFTKARVEPAGPTGG